MKVVVAIDSMKGCLGSKEASEACSQGIREIMPDAVVIALPVADGGEGTAVAIAHANKQIRMQTRVSGPDGSDVDAEWWLDDVKKTAFIDMAAAAGLTLLPGNKRNPMKTSTFGVGQLILAALDEGATHIVVGMGGSATVDGGVGACKALGVKFDEDIDISGIDPRLKNAELSLACDVEAPFTGEKGAARVFGPQKGANPVEVEVLEARLENLRRIILKKFKLDLNDVPGSGAAGGCAGGMVALIGAKIEKGASLVLDSIGFEEIIRDADLIITGEGCADRQTLMGKLPFEILQRGKKSGIPVILVAGKVQDEEALKTAGFAKVIDINSEEIINRSNTKDGDAMDSNIARARLKNCCELKL